MLQSPGYNVNKKKCGSSLLYSTDVSKDNVNNTLKPFAINRHSLQVMYKDRYFQ